MFEGLLNCFKRVFAHISSWIGGFSTLVGLASDISGKKLLVPSYVWWLLATLTILVTAILIQMELDEEKRRNRKPRPEITLAALVARLASSSDVMGTPGIPQKTADALVAIREKANLGLLSVWGRPNAVMTHLNFTPLQPIPSTHWELAQIDYLEYLKDKCCKTKDARPPGTSPHYADLQFDKMEVDEVFPQKASGR